MTARGGVLLAVGLSGFGSVWGQSAQPAGITLNTFAEVEKRRTDSVVERYLLTPADHVVAGDQLVYTVEIRNSTSHPRDGVTVTNPIPERMGYIASSATGPGCDIDFSVDGGISFAKPDALLIALPAGRTRPATAADYTHIRWKLKFSLSGNATAFARFRATLK
jgi:uncharacterized repeat protein (TIGR01451 family)